MPSCRTCKAPIVWIRTISGQAMPCDAEPLIVMVKTGKTCRTEFGDEPTYATVRALRSHFATCPDAAEHRRKKGGES